MVMLASAWMSAAVTAPVLLALIRRVIGSRLVETMRIFLQVEDDVGDILDDAVDGLELVVHAVDLDRRDGGALDGAEEHAAEGVADGVAVTGLEGLGDELGVGRRGAFLDFGELAGEFELSETFGHGDGGGEDLRLLEQG